MTKGEAVIVGIVQCTEPKWAFRVESPDGHNQWVYCSTEQEAQSLSVVMGGCAPYHYRPMPDHYWSGKAYPWNSKEWAALAATRRGKGI